MRSRSDTWRTSSPALLQSDAGERLGGHSRPGRDLRVPEDMYAEVVPAYASTLFHINCDEVSGLGNGPAKRMVDSMGDAGVYAYHINRIADIIRPYGKRMLMWGDIAVGNPQIIDRLPRDLIVVSWGYHAAESFDDAILPFKKSGFEFMVAPGVSCWGRSGLTCPTPW